MTINQTKLRELFVSAEKGNIVDRNALVEVLRPKKTDSVDEILEKIQYFIRIFFVSSLTFEDAPFHYDIDRAFAEQVHSYLRKGKPRYKGLIIYGFRESAKTARVMFNDVYMACYLPEFIDNHSSISEDGGKSSEYNMGIFNILAFSSVSKYFGNIISLDLKKTNKKERQTMTKFTTQTGVTFDATSVRKSKRGTVKVDISTSGEIETKRPTKILFDDIENEVTVLSRTSTEKIQQVMNASIDGMDQVKGFWIILGNFLSLRGNIAYFLNKFQYDENVLVIDIPIRNALGEPMWSAKYCKTDKEEKELAEQGIFKVSIESIERNSDNFETEFMNNPQRSLVYFEERAVNWINDEDLVSERERNSIGFLKIKDAEIHGTYIISVDTAKGVGKDESSFTIIKTDGQRYEEVGNFKSKTIKPETFAPYVATIGREYNNALIIPENNYPGNEFIAFLKPIYNNIYYELKSNGEREYGINTNLKTKPEMLLTMKKILIAQLFTVKSQALYSQILEFPSLEVHSMKERDGSGGHFDLLMSCAIGLWKAGFISSEIKDIERVNEMVERINRDIYSNLENHSW